MKSKLLIAAFVILAFLSPSAVRAQGLALKCAKADVINSKWSGPIEFHFEGDAKQGTLRVAGPFGDFSIPAKRIEIPIDASEKGEAIDAVAKARVKLPALADVNACTAKLAGSGKAEPDDIANARDECLRSLNAVAEGVDAIAQIRLGFTGAPDDSGEDAFVVFKLRYDAPNEASDPPISVEAFPAQCKLTK